MKQLNEIEYKNGFTYRQVKRTDKKALYSQHDKQGNLHGHELFKVQIVKDKEVFGKLIPEHEKFPSNNDFGITAWSVGINVDEAIRKYHKL